MSLSLDWAPSSFSLTSALMLRYIREPLSILLDHRVSADHHAGLNRANKKLWDNALPQDETNFKDMIKSMSQHRRLLFVVNQVATGGPCRSPSPRSPTLRRTICQNWRYTVSPVTP